MAGELRTAATKIRSLPNLMVRAGANTLKNPLQSAFTRDSGGDGRLSGLRNSDRFRVQTSVRGNTTAKGSVRIGPASMRGPAVWLNDGARRRRVGRTRAKHTFDRVVDTELPQAARAMEQVFDQSLR